MTMTYDEIQALLPKHAKPATDQVFYRDLVNHWSHFGPAALVQKLGRGWVTNFRQHGHPVVYKTKGEAMQMADAWVLEVSRAGLHKRPD